MLPFASVVLAIVLSWGPLSIVVRIPTNQSWLDSNGLLG